MTGTGSSATWARHAPPSCSNPTPSPPTASTPGARSCSSTASGGSPTPASTSTLTPGTPAGGAPGRWPIACCAPASSTPRLLGQRRQPSDHQAKLPVGRELSDLLGRQALGPHGQDGHAGAGRAALEQAPRRVGRHLRGRDHLSLLSDSSTTLDVNSPFVPAEGPAACGAADVSPTGRGRGHRKLVRWTRPGTL
jgi:hypothetical protein